MSINIDNSYSKNNNNEDNNYELIIQQKIIKIIRHE